VIHTSNSSVTTSVVVWDPFTRPCGQSMKFSGTYVNRSVGNDTRCTRSTGPMTHSESMSRSHTHPSHSQTSRLLTSSISLGFPVPRVTQCIRVV
jgi:hypothetical protein